MQEAIEQDPNSVEFSRTQGVQSAIPLGGSIVLAVTIFITGPQFIPQSGSNTPLVYTVAALLFFPIIVSCVQRSSGALSNASFYAAARTSGSAMRLFFSVWIMLAGFVTLGALLAQAAAIRANTGLSRVFGIELGTSLVVILMVAIAFTKEILSKTERWRTRTIIFWICALFLFSLAIAASFVRYKSAVTIPKTEPLQHWLIPVSMLASTLWCIDIVLNYRGQYRRRDRTIFWSLISIFFGGNLIAALISIEVLGNPSLMMHNWLSALTWNESRLELFLLFAGFLICFSGLLRVMTRIIRLIGTLILDHAIPSSNDKGESLNVYSAFFGVLVASAAVFLSVTYLLLISGFAALLSIILYLQPLLKKDLSKLSRISLPLHPLIPALTIVLCIFLMWILPLENLYLLGAWLLPGAILFVAYARKNIIPVIQHDRVVTAPEDTSKKTGYRVLVCLNDGMNDSLIRIGSSIATANGGVVLVLRIVETSELVPMTFQRKRGEEEWNQIRDYVEKLGLPAGVVKPIVRMAPDLISGMKATSREFTPDFLLVEWPDEQVERLRKSQMQGLLQMTHRPLGILKGQIDKSEKVTIACGNDSDSLLALQMGEAITSANGCSFEALRIFKRVESSDAASSEVQAAIERSGIHAPAKLIVEQESDLEAGILRMTQDSDLLVMGVANDPISGRPLPDGAPMEIARVRKTATLIVKAKEESGRFLLRRILAQLTNHVTALTPKELSNLLAQLKVGLQARTDFYFMVALAAAIAITGLIMNDGSIVLGAMLVSPLMIPIVGIACGISLGNIDLIRRSGASTFKGMALVLGVGVLMSFLLPNVEPTDQILSRTHPGIYDLIAALAAGGAGAYSLGRRPVAGALPGVAMSLSLEPPLAVAGYGLSTSQFWITGGAFLLFLTNLAAIVLSGAGVYILLGLRPQKKEGVSIVGKAVVAVILVTLILLVPLGFGTYGSIAKSHLKFQIESQFREAALSEQFELLRLKISETDEGFLIHPTVLANEVVTPEKIEKFRSAIEQKVGSPIQIDATILQATRIESRHKNNE
jgi:uncharacterized hydrophobic protein (TIGR00271 family)